MGSGPLPPFAYLQDRMIDTNRTGMDRGRFLRGLLGQAALLAPLVGGALRRAPERPAIPVLEAHIRGFGYHAGPQVLGRMRPGDALDLVREPENPHDADAIAVYWSGHPLGYLPREENRTLARLLDGGAELRAQVVSTCPGAEPWEQCAVRVVLVA